MSYYAMVLKIVICNRKVLHS